jgi:hypothetical protein
MKRNRWVTLTVKTLLWLAPGAALFGTSCGAEFRASAIGASADFLGTTIGTLLEAYFPVDNLVPDTGA